MRCSDFIAFLWKYFENELSAEEREEFDSHLSICPACVNYLQNYRQTVEMGREAFASAPDDPVPQDVPEELIEAILASRKK